MTNDLTIRHDLSTYQAFADTASASAIAGDLLTLAKGRWRSGEEKAPVPPEARFVVNMDEMWTGWVRWFNRKPVEHRINRVSDGIPAPSRSDLGHTDPEVWETDMQGNPRDPWAPTFRIIMRGEISGDLFTFSSSSHGGKDALAKLAGAYAKGAPKHPRQFPVVTLGTETYDHDVYGEVAKPSFKIVGWASWGGEVGSAAPMLDDDVPFAPEWRA
jgi:hypothetical protein